MQAQASHCLRVHFQDFMGGNETAAVVDTNKIVVVELVIQGIAGLIIGVQDG